MGSSRRRKKPLSLRSREEAIEKPDTSKKPITAAFPLRSSKNLAQAGVANHSMCPERTIQASAKRDAPSRHQAVEGLPVGLWCRHNILLRHYSHTSTKTSKKR